MSASSRGYIVEGILRVDGKPVSAIAVTGVILDIDLARLGLPVGLALTAPTDVMGRFRLRIPDPIVAIIDGLQGSSADVIFHAFAIDGRTGGAKVRISANAPPINPVQIDIGTPAVVTQPVEVGLAPEVLDVLLGGGGIGVGAAKPTIAGGYDTRFFEDRLTRLIGANIRGGDGTALQREIDRVVVEQEVAGETRFVFRGAGSPRIAKERLAPGSTAGYGGADRSLTASAATMNSAVMPDGGGASLGGSHGILYRRAAAELDSARQALAVLQPREAENSTRFNAIRSLIDEGLVDLVSSLGSAIRPPKARTQAAFDEIRGVAGRNGIEELGILAGFQKVGNQWQADEVSLAEEQTFTRFLELESYVESLRTQWNVLVADNTLNVRSTILGRRLGFVGDAVRELDLALETAPGDPSERQFAPIDRDGTRLDEYIAWLGDFVTDSLAQVREGTVAGLEAIARDAGRLARVANDALNPPAGGWGNPPVVVVVTTWHPVRRALEELGVNLLAIEAGR